MPAAVEGTRVAVIFLVFAVSVIEGGDLHVGAQTVDATCTASRYAAMVCVMSASPAIAASSTLEQSVAPSRLAVSDLRHKN
jgi:hypothetical protein